MGIHHPGEIIFMITAPQGLGDLQTSLTDFSRFMVHDGVLKDGTEILLDEEDENDRSLGLLIEDGSFRYFTTGDLTGGGFSGSRETADVEIAVAPLVGDIDILHINHHGTMDYS